MDIFLISEKKKAKNLIRQKKIKKNNVIDPKKFLLFINNLEKGKIIIDDKSCSIFF